MNRDDTVVAALEETDLFAGVDKKSLKRVAQTVTLVTHDADKEVAGEGRDGVAFHLILEGEAEVTKGGNPRRTLRRGDYFGEIALIDGKPRTATVRAVTPLKTASIVTRDFQPLLETMPEVSLAMLRALCARIREAEDGQPQS